MAIPVLLFSRELRRLGESPRHLERAAAAGSLVRLRPGVFTVASQWADATVEEQHLARIRAVAATSRRPLVFSHASAATVLQLGTVDMPLGRPHVTQPPGLDARLVGVVTHESDLDPVDVVEVDGLRVTAPVRTAMDVAASGSFIAGVVVLDQAIAAGVEREALVERLERTRPFRGARRVEAASDVAHGRSESVLESLSLARIIELGFPAPVQQYELAPHRGDFVWPRYRIWGEADGLDKYTDPAVLWAEKRREDDIRRTFPTFLRWGWDDAWRSTPLEALLLNAGLPRDRRIASRRRA